MVSEIYSRRRRTGSLIDNTVYGLPTLHDRAGRYSPGYRFDGIQNRASESW